MLTVLLSTLLFLLTGCNYGRSTEPTLVEAVNLTHAYETVNARLTENRRQTGTPEPTTPFATESGLPTETPIPTPPAADTLVPTSATGSQVNDCDRAAAAIPIDVTIPDDTQMLPGDTFTKIWRLRNVGSCTWSQQYHAAYFSGERLDAPASVPMPYEVPPGDSVEITVDMSAPSQVGVYQSNWKLRNAAGDWFGIGPNWNSSFWVRIEVLPTPTPTTEPGTPTSTPSSTPSPTTEVHTSGSISLLPDQSLDIDSQIIEPESGADLHYQPPTGAGEDAALTPLDSFAWMEYGETEPLISDCHGVDLHSDPLGLDALQNGLYYCYRTDLGLPGWLRMISWNEEDGAVELEMLTWRLP